MNKLRALLLVLFAFVLAAPAEAATLYISEFPNAVSQIGSATAQVPPQAAITDQTVALSGASARSAAFSTTTKAVMLTCDQGCSVTFGGSTASATTSNNLLQQGVPYLFSVNSGTFVAAITNTAGNLPGSGGVASNVTVVGALPAGANTIGTVTTIPLAFTSITASATGTTAATAATLPGVSAKTTYMCGFTITADATAALAGAATVTGTISGSLNYIQNVGAATSAGILAQTFQPCVPASAVNTAIVITSVAAGTAGSTAVTAWGYQQ